LKERRIRTQQEINNNNDNGEQGGENIMEDRAEGEIEDVDMESAEDSYYDSIAGDWEDGGIVSDEATSESGDDSD